MSRLWVPGKPRLEPGTPLERAWYAAHGVDAEPRHGPVVLRARFIFDAAYKPNGAAVPITQPSLPGLVRGVLNELNGIAWDDERLLVAVNAGKEYGNVSGTQLSW